MTGRRRILFTGRKLQTQTSLDFNASLQDVILQSYMRNAYARSMQARTTSKLYKRLSERARRDSLILPSRHRKINIAIIKAN